MVLTSFPTPKRTSPFPIFQMFSKTFFSSEWNIIFLYEKDLQPNVHRHFISQNVVFAISVENILAFSTFVQPSCVSFFVSLYDRSVQQCQHFQKHVCYA